MRDTSVWFPQDIKGWPVNSVKLCPLLTIPQSFALCHVETPELWNNSKGLCCFGVCQWLLLKFSSASLGTVGFEVGHCLLWAHLNIGGHTVPEKNIGWQSQGSVHQVRAACSWEGFIMQLFIFYLEEKLKQVNTTEVLAIFLGSSPALGTLGCLYIGLPIGVRSFSSVCKSSATRWHYWEDGGAFSRQSRAEWN